MKPNNVLVNILVTPRGVDSVKLLGRSDQEYKDSYKLAIKISKIVKQLNERLAE